MAFWSLPVLFTGAEFVGGDARDAALRLRSCRVLSQKVFLTGSPRGSWSPTLWTPLGLQKKQKATGSGRMSLIGVVGPPRLELETSTVSR
jgi:hypothetical protein